MLASSPASSASSSALLYSSVDRRPLGYRAFPLIPPLPVDRFDRLGTETDMKKRNQLAYMCQRLHARCMDALFSYYVAIWMGSNISKSLITTHVMLCFLKSRRTHNAHNALHPAQFQVTDDGIVSIITRLVAKTRWQLPLCISYFAKCSRVCVDACRCRSPRLSRHQVQTSAFE